VRDDGSLHVLFLGSLSPEKNPAAALDVFERVGQPDRFKLRFVGGGPLESELRQLSGSMLDMGVVEFAGSVRDVAPHLEWADVLLLPSITEGLPGAVLEAGAAGVPTVAFDVGGTAEAIINNETGLLVSAGDVESLADELRSLQADAELLSRLGTGARDLVVDRFLLGDTINNYIDLLESAITPTRRRSRPTRPG
jgi:glycosyltransferase involved in cell wall biosynthesis